MAQMPLPEFIDELHAGAIVLSVTLTCYGDQKLVAEYVVDYLHQCLATLDLDDARKAVIDRMAAKIAANGFDLNYGAYSNI